MADQFNILDYTEGPLLKTGQITDFTPAGRTTKDDGGFQRGIAGSKLDAQYNILTTGQYAGTTNITVNAIVDAHTNACVFDKVTGLMFNREQTPLIYGTGAQGLLWDDTAGADEDIFKYCDQANLSALSNFIDWRVPNIEELYSLFNLEKNPSIPNITAFPVWPTPNIWSSTTSSNNTTRAKQVFQVTGANITASIKISTRDPVVLVRLGI